MMIDLFSSLLYHQNKFISFHRQLIQIDIVMKKLNSSRSSRTSISKNLSSISANHPLFNKDRLSIPCAFHPTEKITNFCKDMNCLLPLCPKCVQIHSEEHAKMGIFSSFHTIDQCFQQAHSQFLNIFSSVSKLQQISFEIEDSYKKKKQSILNDFSNAKAIAHNYLQNILQEYQQALSLELKKNDRQFSESLLHYHGYIDESMQKCKRGAKKMSNKAELMQGLINFYSEERMIEGLRECEERLNEFGYKKIGIEIKQYELERFASIVKRFLIINGNDGSFEGLINETKLMKRVYEKGELYESCQIVAPKSFVRQSHKIEQMSSPLDNFSLSKSRNVKLRLQPLND